VGVSQVVGLVLNSRAHQAYGQESAVETFQCQYGLNEKYRDSLRESKLKITGLDKEGHVRIVELQDHPFFIASLFLPQLSSQAGRPHPLIRSFLQAAVALKAGA
jgi:CTP synthase (UTP-ammonia lyase)